MKKLVYSLLTLIILSTVYSCKDDSLDPLQVGKIQKGKLLALRGTQLQNIYFVGKPGAEVFPKIATAADQFSFEGEYLSDDPNSLESIDVFVLKANGTATPDKVLLTNVPFSSFKDDGKYRNPYVSVTVPLSEILSKLGLSNTFPLSTGTINALLTTYKFGINIWTDLKLKDGTIAAAEKVVASGLFQSDQFYPAQKLVYTVTDYCSYSAPFWTGTFTANEIYSSGVYGPYNLAFTRIGSTNQFQTSNFWDFGLTAYMEFTVSSNPSTQTVIFPVQNVGGGGSIEPGSKGTYDQCTGVINVNLIYKEPSGALNSFRYNLVKQP
jgi:hypothetical protein